ncbi:hypothetical protein QOZ80_3BG0254190 [Eleusine coracana subsp. coracana]|nr:hypothetical protein QOZ80_3BG0254190 [Eleusine coracana subsp. coracana]
MEVVKPMFVGRAERERFALERLQVQAASVSHQHRSEKSPHQRALTTSNSSSSERHLERDQQQRGLDPKDYYYLRQDRKRSRRDGSECTRKWQREGDEQQEKMDREKELEAIQEQYLGSKKPKKNVIKPSGRSRFSFDWESTDDTTSYALYRSSPHGAGLLFGRGFLAGIDRREQKKAAAEAHEEARAERRRKDLPLPAEDDVTNKKKKKAGASAFSTSCALDMRVERRWSEKTLEEMTERDWRVFRDHFEISYKTRPRYMFSATMPPPVERVARKYLRNPVVVTIGTAGMATDLVVQNVVMVKAESEKMSRLQNILGDLARDKQKAIVFCNTRRTVDMRAKDLDKAGFRVTTLHGGKSQEQREVSLDGFRNRQFGVLVAADLAARGIDVPDVAHVINYEMPGSIQSYTHRIGRTGRAGNKGVATSFLTLHDTDIFYHLKQMLVQSNSYVPPELAKHKASKFKPASVPTDRPPRHK